MRPDAAPTTTVSGTTVWRAQHAQSETLSGNQRGRWISSGGMAGRSSQDQSPTSASQIRVNTRVDSTPPCARTNAAAAAM